MSKVIIQNIINKSTYECDTNDVIHLKDSFVESLRHLKQSGAERNDIEIKVYDHENPDVINVIKSYGLNRLTFLDEQEQPKSLGALIVEDSPVMAKIIHRILLETQYFNEIKVVDSIKRASAELNAGDFDLITLDFNLLDGEGSQLIKEHPHVNAKTILITECHVDEGQEIMDMLSQGLLAYFQKPQLNQIEKLQSEVKQLLEHSFKRKAETQSKLGSAKICYTDKELIVIGSSTGGTEVIKQLIEGFPLDTPPIVIVQHMPETFTGAFAERLSRQTKRTVHEVKHPISLQKGHAYLAGGGLHSEIFSYSGELFVRPKQKPEVNGFRPSVSVLFDSVFKQGLAPNCIAIMLTGMGSDGALELKKLKDAGAITIGQSEASCVVYGMPKAAKELGALKFEASPQEMIKLFR